MSELIGEYTIRSRSYLRETEGTGRFAAAAAAGGDRALEALGNEFARLVRAAIAASTKRRTGELLGSVRWFQVSAQEVDILSDSDHVAPLDRGAVAHWIPNAFGRGVAVWHPGNHPPKRFFGQAEEVIRRIAPEIIKEHMP